MYNTIQLSNAYEGNSPEYFTEVSKPPSVLLPRGQRPRAIEHKGVSDTEGKIFWTIALIHDGCLVILV